MPLPLRLLFVGPWSDDEFVRTLDTLKRANVLLSAVRANEASFEGRRSVDLILWRHDGRTPVPSDLPEAPVVVLDDGLSRTEADTLRRTRVADCLEFRNLGCLPQLILRTVEGQRRLDRAAADARHVATLRRVMWGIAHDLNNLICVITNCSWLLQTRKDAANAGAYVTELSEAADRGAKLVRSLQAFGGEVRGRPRAVQLGDVLERCRRLLRLTLEDVDVRCERDGPVGTVLAEPLRIEQMLVHAAIHLRDRGEDLQELEILATPRFPQSTVRVEMRSDQSLSTPDQLAPEVPVRGGRYGLAPSLELAEQLGIALHADRWPDPTAFTFDFPLHDAEVDIDSGAPGRGEVVIVLEPDERILEMAIEILREAGYETYAMRRASQIDLIIEMLERPIDLLILSTVLPDSSPGAIARRFREKWPKARTLCVSAAGDAPGMPPNTPVLWKPFAPESLRRAARRVLDEKSIPQP